MPEAAPTQMLVAEFRDDVVPVGRVAQDRGGGAASAGAGEHAGIGIGACCQDALGDERADLLDDRYLSCPLARGAFVDETAGGGSRLAPDGPDSVGRVPCQVFLFKLAWPCGAMAKCRLRVSGLLRGRLRKRRREDALRADARADDVLCLNVENLYLHNKRGEDHRQGWDNQVNPLAVRYFPAPAPAHHRAHPRAAVPHQP
ncbi:hypothetical protein GCM10017562_62500 [Streptomyces roseofulvus]